MFVQRMRTEPGGVLHRKASIRAFAAMSSQQSKQKREAMRLLERPQEELHEMLRGKKVVYVGATVNRKERATAHASRFPGRNMYYAPPQKMKNDEERLFDACPKYLNIQRGSNVPQKKGFVYIIY
ncbi:hypothetical protein BaRGS_00038540 [Batillaria attramentaria]|uniref:GIY-YIG domain-containing protein n=1 Tax=Batillaria attramentaria TaxID=370345 RepID=A0ABD0J6Z3_9CAEN